MRPAVIFDMDGVLVDSFASHRDAWKAMAIAEGLTFDPARFTAAFGRTSREVITHLWGQDCYTDAQIVALDNQREAAYRDTIHAHFPAMPGAQELIASLNRGGFALALASSGPPENAQLVLEKLGARHLFGAVVTGKDVSKGKPDPEVFLVAASRLRVPPSLCAVIEDAPAGIAAANLAGMFSIGLASTGRTRQSLASARLVIDSLQELSPSLIRQHLNTKETRP
jgi:HAD superfamily hydrolase (TIGR01509 family)